MTLVYPDESGIIDYCLKEVIPEWLLGVIIFPVCAVIRANLVGLIHTIHEMIIHVNEIRNLKVLTEIRHHCSNKALFYLRHLYLGGLTQPPLSPSISGA